MNINPLFGIIIVLFGFFSCSEIPHDLSLDHKSIIIVEGENGKTLTLDLADLMNLSQLGIGLSLHAQQGDKLIIAAAADLRFALDSIVTEFGHANRIDVVYGSSGKLYEQISNSAPFDIYFSADMNYPKLLENKGLTASELYFYGIGRLVLWSKNPKTSLSMHTLTDNSIRKIAIANPKHAPYGERAVEALQHYQIYESAKNKLVFGENISQTAQFVASGAADIGVVALSLVLSPNMKRINANYFLIPEESHTPLLQAAVITRHGRDKALAFEFLEFVKKPQSQEILLHFGFSKPQAK